MSNVQNNREHYTWSRRSQHFHTLRMYYSNGGWNKLWKSITIWGGDTLCLVSYWFLISRRRYKTSLPHHSLLLTLSSIAYMSRQGWVSAMGLQDISAALQYSLFWTLSIIAACMSRLGWVLTVWCGVARTVEDGPGCRQLLRWCRGQKVSITRFSG